MSRYIDADKILYTDLSEGRGVCWVTFMDWIKEMPTADVVEVEKVNKIYEKLADLFDTPCNFSPCDEIMLESERCIEDCGNISDAECWKRYFEVVCGEDIRGGING